MCNFVNINIEEKDILFIYFTYTPFLFRRISGNKKARRKAGAAVAYGMSFSTVSGGVSRSSGCFR